MKWRTVPHSAQKAQTFIHLAGSRALHALDAPVESAVEHQSPPRKEIIVPTLQPRGSL
jgi:hypothetical protein